MNFDTVIIGGGLAGLTCGIALQKQGKHCVIINNGQSALDFSSGSMDLLSRLPDGTDVESLDKSFEKLTALLPQHPYAILGRDQVFATVAQFEQLAKDLALGLEGTMQANHDRVTPLGGIRPTWLSADSVPVNQRGEKFPYDSIAVLGIEGFHDFQPNLLVENLQQQAEFAHCEFVVGYLNIPELDQLRERSREFRSVNIAQLLEQKLQFSDLVKELKEEAKGKSAVFIPACFGLDSQAFLHELRQATGLALFEVPTIPPSLLGIRQHKKLRHHFESLGGLMLNGDRALRAEFDGDRVTKIFTQLHQDQAISADNFVLASGSFFSNGLKAEFERIFEPLFGADILQQGEFKATDRLSWTHSRFAQPQPYQSAGVVINEKCQVRKGGKFLQNVYATGSVIGGYNAIALGCGSGVAVATALTIAQQLGEQ